jgi:hypothetical protein
MPGEVYPRWRPLHQHPVGVHVGGLYGPAVVSEAAAGAAADALFGIPPAAANT